MKNDVLKRLDSSHNFWERYGVRNEKLKKKLGYFSIKNIDDPCVVTVAVNPKEYFEEFESQSVNKKCKGLRKGVSGMEFEYYAKRINSLGEIETFAHLPKGKYKQNRFTIKNNSMVLDEIEKSKFVQINDKRYYFSDGIVFLSFPNPFLKEIVNFKRGKKPKSRGVFTAGKTQTYSDGKICSRKKQKNFNL